MERWNRVPRGRLHGRVRFSGRGNRFDCLPHLPILSRSSRGIHHDGPVPGRGKGTPGMPSVSGMPIRHARIVNTITRQNQTIRWAERQFRSSGTRRNGPFCHLSNIRSGHLLGRSDSRILDRRRVSDGGTCYVGLRACDRGRKGNGVPPSSNTMSPSVLNLSEAE